jgi:[ribosomal protein S5]-alanine N-acetyltransferase
MHFPPDILTERLRLVAITPRLLRADLSTLSQLVRADVPASWPPEHWEPHVFDLLEQQYLTTPITLAWNRYIVLRGESPILIGSIGAFAKPEAEAEVGYSVLLPWQCRGFATESLRALLPAILQSNSVQTISAHTFPHLIASVRVLEKCGFTLIGPGQEEGTIRYQLTAHRSTKTLSHTNTQLLD